MSDKLVTIATFDTLPDASCAKDQLETEGVRAVLADTETVGMMWHLTSAFGGIKLQVMSTDAEHTIAILNFDGFTSASSRDLQPIPSRYLIYGMSQDRINIGVHLVCEIR